ncbi:MAG: hypothetical protein AMS23_02695 [Bacteroides sp. SM1_62]|nr:MAG: hypothetical protein AMS26_00075 [Bacteroides sp. SM23_62]KPL26202.1 MAG: hypothetical protein AMS23_02695 [Bacteroides sp. SM1_62]
MQHDFIEAKRNKINQVYIKTVMMKKNPLKSLFALLLIASAMTACGKVDECKSCSKVTYQDGNEISRTPGVVYCGDELAEKENTPPVTILGVTTVWECN